MLGLGALLSSQTGQSPGFSTSTRNTPENAKGDVGRCGTAPIAAGKHSPNKAPALEMQYSGVPEGMQGSARGHDTKARPPGVKVEYFASVRRHPPRPITPLASMRYSRNVSVPAQQTEMSPVSVFGHETGTGVQLPVGGGTSRIHPSESSSYLPTRATDFPCDNSAPRPVVPLARPNCGQSAPFVPQELRPLIPQHPRQPKVNLPKAGLDCILPPQRGALPHGRPQGPPLGDVISGGSVPILDVGDIWPQGRRHQHPMFTETREGFPRTKAAPPPDDHDSIHVDDYHLEQPEDHGRYLDRGSFGPSSAVTRESECDERQNWLPQRSWSKSQSSWADADVNGGRLGDEGDGQTTQRKVMPLMSIKSFPTRQFSGEFTGFIQYNYT